MFGECREAAFLLVRVPKDADEYSCGFEIAGTTNVVDGDEADFGHGELAPDGFANGALQHFADSVMTEIGHGFVKSGAGG